MNPRYFIFAIAIFILASTISAGTTVAPRRQKFPPSAAQRERCRLVGVSSGCSGCSDPRYECEWCVNPNDAFDGTCGVKGWCEVIKTGGGEDFVEGAFVCPRDPAKEPVVTGRDTPIKTQLQFSTAHSSNYCEFPKQPWVVDRTFAPIDFDTGNNECNKINTELLIGTRGELDRCLLGKLGYPGYSNGNGAYTKRDLEKMEFNISTVLTLKRKECVRYYQSLLCTVRCPQYGVALSTSRMCNSVCEKLNQICDADMLSCMEASLPFNTCLPESETDCYDPDLVPQSGKFEFDLCFFGSRERCEESVEEGTIGPIRVAPLEN